MDWRWQLEQYWPAALAAGIPHVLALAPMKFRRRVIFRYPLPECAILLSFLSYIKLNSWEVCWGQARDVQFELFSQMHSAECVTNLILVGTILGAGLRLVIQGIVWFLWQDFVRLEGRRNTPEVID